MPYLVPNLDQTVDSYGDFDGGDKGLVSHHSLYKEPTRLGDESIKFNLASPVSADLETPTSELISISYSKYTN